MSRPRPATDAIARSQSQAVGGARRAFWPRLALRAGSGYRLRLDRLLHPVTLLLAPALLSAIVWAIPWGREVHRGFASANALSPAAIALLAAWYGLTAAAAWYGFRLGRGLRPWRSLDGLDDDRYFLALTLIAAAGVGYVYGVVVLRHPGVIWHSLSHQTFNELRDLIPRAAGPQTLRYTADISGAVALYRLTAWRRLSWLIALNLVLLGLASAFSSRQSLVIALLMAGALWARARPGLGVPAAVIMLTGVAFFLITTPLTYVRTAGWYRVHYGINDPLLMNANEFIAYLGSPTQAAVGVAGRPELRTVPRLAPADPLVRQFVVPVYLEPTPPAVVDRDRRFLDYVGLEAEMNTDQPFARMFSTLGYLAFPLMAAIALAAAAVAGHATRYRSLFALSGLAACYAFSELWRIYVFNFGVVHFLIALLIAVPLLFSGAHRLRRRFAGRAPFARR